MRQVAAATPRPPAAAWFERALFVGLAALLAVRPLLTESYERVDLPFMSADAALGPTPAATVLLDGLTLVIAGAALVRRGWPSRVFIASVVALTLAVALSTIAADSKRVALNAGATLVAFAVAGAAVFRLTDSRARTTLLVAALLASVTTNAAKCMMQRGYEFDDTLQMWTEQKAARAAHGEVADDAATENFERRMRSQNAFGYLAHPNVAGSIMAAGAAVALILSAAAARAGKLPAAGLSALLAGAASVGVWLTGSVGAMAALVAGLLAAVPASLGWSAKATIRTLIVAYIAALIGLTAFGLARGTLPGASLAFRWEYWTAAARALPDAGVMGLGRENFVTAHIRYKPPTATEEVRNPHNLWVSLWIEMGPLGLAAGAALLAAAVWTATRAATGDFRLWLGNGGIPRTDAALMATSVLALHAVFSGTPFDKPGIGVLWFAELALLWTTAYAMAAFAISAAVGEARAARIAALAGLAAAGVLLVHNVVDFSLLTPAGLATLAAFVPAWAGLAGQSAVGTAAHVARAGPRGAVVLRVSAIVVAALVYVATIVQPTVTTTQLVAQADAEFAKRANPEKTVDQIEKASAIDLAAANADSLDGETPRRAARRQLQLALQASVPTDLRSHFLVQAERLAQLSRSRSSQSVPIKRLLARIADATSTPGRTDTLVLAATRWDDVTTAYPTSAQDHLDAGLAYFRVWQATHEPDASGGALDHFQAARRIDDTRPKENASKLHPDELNRIRAAQEEMQPTLMLAATRWDEVTAVHPTSAQDHLDAGVAYFRLWQATHEPGPAGSALDHFQAALRIDDTRPKENASKLRPDELTRIRTALEEMQPEIRRRAEERP